MRFGSFALVVVAACGSPAREGQVARPLPSPSASLPAAHPVAPAYERWIEQLATVDASGIGFSPNVTGSQFLPVASSNEQGMLLLGRAPPARSEILTRLVAAGADAVPALLRHLGDRTPTRVPPVKGMMWQTSDDEYDVNRRTTKSPPGTNRDGPTEDPSDHVVSVGDLCFVALGQIVNRSFAAVRYQPTGGLVVSSPPLSPALLAAARAEWGSLDRASLRASLARDFREPDFAGRREGALLRLAYYAPDDARALLDAETARPTYDSFAASAFARSLYGQSRAARAAAFAAYARDPAARDGLEQALFEDLATQEAYEQKRISPATTGAGYRARECLVELYGLPATVKATDRPYPIYASAIDRERLLAIAKNR